MSRIYDINLEGIGKINGGHYKDIKISGIGTILNDITCEKVLLEGVCKVNGNINCTDISIEGTFNSNGKVEAHEKILVKGHIKLGESIQSREVSISGKFEINGLLSGDEIKILFIGKNRVKEIGGEVITVLQEKKSFLNGTILPNKLVSDSIEGDIIVLENTECNIVRGQNITIKSGCKINRIEYTGEIEIDKNSKVESVIKL